MEISQVAGHIRHIPHLITHRELPVSSAQIGLEMPAVRLSQPYVFIDHIL